MHRKHRLFKSSAQLFAKFQMTVFNEPQSECDENQFFDFLVDSPLKVLCSALEGSTCSYYLICLVFFSQRKVMVSVTGRSISSIGWMVN